MRLLKGVITEKILNGVVVTYENGFMDRCTDDPNEEPFFVNFEVGQEVEWALPQEIVDLCEMPAASQTVN